MPQGKAASSFVVDITARTGPLKNKMREAEQVTSKAAKSMGASLTAVAAATTKVNVAASATPAIFARAAAAMGAFRVAIQGAITKLVSLKGLFLVIGGAATIAVGKAISTVNARFESLRVTLNKIEGGAEGGLRALNFIKGFAETTPFTVETLTKAFIQLQTSGVTPTVKLLTTLGDAASIAIRPVEALEAAVKVIQRSTQGGLSTEDLDILNNLGIPIYDVLLKQIGVARSGVGEFAREAVGAGKVVQAMLAGFDARFGGALADALDTLTTKISNAGEASVNLALAFGNTKSQIGFTKSVKFLLDNVIQLFGAMEPLTKVIGTVFAGALATATVAVRTLLFPLELLSNGIGKLQKALEPAPAAINETFFNLENRLKIADALLKKEETILEQLRKNGNKPVEGVTAQSIEMTNFNDTNNKDFENAIAAQEKRVKIFKNSRDTHQKILDEHGKELDLSGELKKARLELAQQQEILKVKKARVAAAIAPTEYSEQNFANDDKTIEKLEADVEAHEAVVSRYSVAVDNLIAATNQQGAEKKTQPPTKEFTKVIQAQRDAIKIAQLRLTDLTDQEIKFIKAAKRLKDIRVLFDSNGLVKGYEIADEQNQKRFIDSIRGNTDNIGIAVLNAENAIAKTELLTGLQGELAAAQAKLSGVDQTADYRFGQLTKNVQFKGDEKANTRSVFDKIESTNKQIEANDKRIAAAEKKADARQKASESRIKNAQTAIKGLTNDESALEKTQRILNEAVEEFGVDALPGVEQALQRVGDQIRQSDPLFQSLIDGMKNVSSGVSDALADMVVNAKFSFSSLKDVFGTFVRQLISKAIELVFINRIINAIFGAGLPTGNAPGFGGFFSGKPGPTVGLGHPGLRADGGPIVGGKPYVVGEEGPEIIVPKSAGTVLSNSASRSLVGVGQSGIGRGGGDTIIIAPEINVTGGGGGGESAIEQAEIIATLVEERVAATINDRRKRGMSAA